MLSQGVLTRLNNTKNNKNKNEDPELIKSLILLDQKFKKITKECFKDHLLFQKAQSDAFEYIMIDENHNK
jgi:hypothetical protein